jgi:hypothetical protein
MDIQQGSGQKTRQGVQKEQLDALTEIRSLMERSSRFISLSGISGISAGTVAILGAIVAGLYQGAFFWEKRQVSRIYDSSGSFNDSDFLFYLADAVIVFIAALCTSIYFTARKAKAKNLPVWDNMAKKLVFNLFVPLATGGLFSLLLFYYGVNYLIAPAMLIFYGLALINASKYTIGEIHYLGFIEIILGFICAMVTGYGLLFWVLGFGVMHILYGIYMHFKHER